MQLIPYAVGAVVAGVSYESLSSFFDRRAHPPTGTLVDLGGRRLHVHCEGQARPGVPTVIIETGIFDCAASWTLVRPKIAEFTQVVTYDRAGYGDSDEGPSPRSFDQITDDLHALIQAQGLTPPFVFVGHSLGGALVRYYHSRFPEEVAGLTLVDPVAFEMPAIPRAIVIAGRTVSYLGCLGVPRLTSKLMGRLTANPSWTPEMQETYVAVHRTRAKTLATCLAEADAMPASMDSLRLNKKIIRNIPTALIVRDPDLPLRPGVSPQEHAQHRKDLERMCEQQFQDMEHRRVVVAHGSSHAIHLDKPEVIVEEIRAMVQKASQECMFRE